MYIYINGLIKSRNVYKINCGCEMLFIDFKGVSKNAGHWLNKKMKARPLGHSVMDAVWPLHLDGMIFTDSVTPSTRIQVHPLPKQTGEIVTRISAI